MNIKAWIITSIFLGLQIHGNILLKAHDEYGQSATTFNVGVPWTIEVALQDMPEVKERPIIQGLDGAYVRDSSIMTMSINGKTTTKYSYKVRFDAVGTYTIGPALIDKAGKKYNSNTLVIKIIDQPIDQSDAKEKNSSVLFVRMKVDKDHVVVGERFKCTLRCYYTDQVSQVAPSSTMQIPGFIFEDGAQQANGVESIKGRNYNYFELCWNAYATQIGKKIIPAYGVEYMVSTNPYGNHASAIAMMFGHTFGEKKRAYSNAIPMTIVSLPVHTGPIHAIGTFTHIGAKIDPIIAKQGEGMVFTLEIVGQGSFSNDHPIELQNMPPQFKYYDSKQYDDRADNSKKYFEFIVQGLEEGIWQIPSQTFTFFDTKTRTYKTLKTDAIRVKILPGTVSQQQEINLFSPHDQSDGQQVSETDDIKPFFIQGDVLDNQVASLPLWLMVILMLLPLGFFAYTQGYVSYVINAMHAHSRTKNAFVVARAEIKSICAAQRFDRLYTVFTHLIAIRCKVPEYMVGQEFINALFKKEGMHDQEIEQWNQFYNQLNELMFFNKPIKPHEYKVVQEYANRWLDRLEKIL